jgi:hypothetical protein
MQTSQVLSNEPTFTRWPSVARIAAVSRSRSAAQDHEAGKPNPRSVRIDGLVHDPGYEPIGHPRARRLGLRPVTDRVGPRLGRNASRNGGLLEGRVARSPTQPHLRGASPGHGVPHDGRHQPRDGTRPRRSHPKCTRHLRDHQSDAYLHGMIRPREDARSGSGDGQRRMPATSASQLPEAIRSWSARSRPAV